MDFEGVTMDGRKSREGMSAKPDPSPAEIRRRCWAIQDGWTERQRREREGCFVVDAVEVEIVEEVALAFERC
jgi:hypothetical protein